MKKNFIISMMMALMAVMTVTTLTACGSDDDDPITEPQSEKGVYEPSYGVQKIDISIEGDLEGWNASMLFSGIIEDGKYCNLYENGKLISPIENVPAKITSCRSCSVYTDMVHGFMTLIMSLNKAHLHSGNLTVHLKGYTNDKLITEKTFYVDGTVYSSVICFDNLTEKGAYQENF